jgi:hypothetical protein
VRFTEINLFGVYVAPMSLLMVGAWVVTIALRRFATRRRAGRAFPLFVGAVYSPERRLGVYRGSAPLLEVERIDDDFKLMQCSLAARSPAAMS